MVPLRGRLVTGDALSCQHTRCQQIRQAHGHSLFVIKLNQPEVFAEVALFFDHPPPGERFTTASSRRIQRARHEVRPLTAAAALANYLAERGWAGAQQVLRLARCVTHQGPAHAAPTPHLCPPFLTTSASPVPAPP